MFTVKRRSTSLYNNNNNNNETSAVSTTVAEQQYGNDNILYTAIQNAFCRPNRILVLTFILLFGRGQRRGLIALTMRIPTYIVILLKVLGEQRIFARRRIINHEVFDIYTMIILIINNYNNRTIFRFVLAECS